MCGVARRRGEYFQNRRALPSRIGIIVNIAFCIHPVKLQEFDRRCAAETGCLKGAGTVSVGRLRTGCLKSLEMGSADLSNPGREAA
jgi:hypothetical protein